MRDFLFYSFIFIMSIVLLGMAATSVYETRKCNKAGGIYIEGQCLKAETIKL